MFVPDCTSTHRSTRRPGRGAVLTALSLAVGLSVVSPVAAGAAERSATVPAATYRVVATPEAVAGSAFSGTSVDSAQAAPFPLTTTIAEARTALTTAVTSLQNRQFAKANTALTTLRVKLGDAHQAGMAPMGPARVLSVFTFEHRVAMRLLPAFNGLTRSDVINALQTTLSTTLANRSAMLSAVVALPLEGAGADYDDGLADTLPIYGAEVQAYNTALNQFQLIPQSRAALTKDLAQVRATRRQFAGRFGGGE